MSSQDLSYPCSAGFEWVYRREHATVLRSMDAPETQLRAHFTSVESGSRRITLQRCLCYGEWYNLRHRVLGERTEPNAVERKQRALDHHGIAVWTTRRGKPLAALPKSTDVRSAPWRSVVPPRILCDCKERHW